MRLMFALLGILLITSGVIVLGTPYLNSMQPVSTAAVEPEAPGTRSFKKRRQDQPRRQSLLDQVRIIAEKANAPLSIVFGFMSLYYTRRTYHAQRPPLNSQ